MTIGFKIKKLREKHDFSQQDLAHQLDISQTKLSNIENDSTEKVDFVLMDKICQIFSVDFSYFLEPEKQINTIKDNNHSVVLLNSNHVNVTFPYDVILEQVKLLIDDVKQKDARIRELETMVHK